MKMKKVLVSLSFTVLWRKVYKELGKSIVLALMLLPTIVSAQEIEEIVDSMDVDPYENMIIETYYTDTGELASDTIYLNNPDEDSAKISQDDLKEYDIDICYDNPRYAVISKDGKKGIYDLVSQENITKMEFRELNFSQRVEGKDSIIFNMFYAKKGIKHGLLGVEESTNIVMSTWKDDPDEVYSLDECTTIDNNIEMQAKKLLEDLIHKQHMNNAQIVILDAKSGRLKTWIALDENMDKEDAGKLLVHSCSASLAKPFHTVMALENEGLPLDSICKGMSYRQGIKTFNNEVMYQTILRGYHRKLAEGKWMEMTDTQNPSTSPLVIAVGYNSLVNEGKMIVPTMNADSIYVDEDEFSLYCITNLQDVLKVDKSESPQLAWLDDEINWLGYAGTENIYAEDDKQRINPIGKQIQFAGLFPAENPQYTICIVADKQSIDVNPSAFQDVVNPLATWLLK